MVCAAASRRDQVRATCLSGGAIGLIVPEVGAGADHDRDAGLAQAAYALGELAHRGRRAASPWVTSLAPIRITATSGSIGSARSIWAAEVGGPGAHDRELAQVDPAVGALGQAAGEQRARASPRPGPRRSRRRWSRRAARP